MHTNYLVTKSMPLERMKINFVIGSLPFDPFYFLALGSKVCIGRKFQSINSSAIVDYEVYLYDWPSNHYKVYLCLQLELLHFYITVGT